MYAGVTPAWVWTGRKYPASLCLSPSGIWVGIHRLLQSVWTGRVGAPALPQIPSSWMQTQPLLQTPQGVNLITLIRHFFPPCLDYICFWSGLGDSGCCQMLSHGMFGSRLNCRFPAFMKVCIFLVYIRNIPIKGKVIDCKSSVCRHSRLTIDVFSHSELFNSTQHVHCLWSDPCHQEQAEETHSWNPTTCGGKAVGGSDVKHSQRTYY